MNAGLKLAGLHGAHLLGRNKYTHSPYCRLDSLDQKLDGHMPGTAKERMGESSEGLPDSDLSEKDQTTQVKPTKMQ